MTPRSNARRSHRALGLERLVVAEVVPEPERDGRQLQAAPAATAVGLDLVAVIGGGVGHRARLTPVIDDLSPIAPEVIRHGVRAQGLGELGHPIAVDHIDARPVDGAETADRRLQQVQVVRAQPQ